MEETIPNENLPRIAHCEPAGIMVEPGKVYSWCTCGLTEKTPFCDSNHKKIEGTPFKSVKVLFDKAEEIWFCQCKQTKTPPFCDGTHKNPESLKASRNFINQYNCMLPAWLWLKIRKKLKPVYIRSRVSLRRKIANPEKRIKLNKWYNKMSGENKSLFFHLYADLFKDKFTKISEGEWMVDFAGRSIRLPLWNNELGLNWNLAIAIAGHNNEVKATYENLILSGAAKVVFDIGANYGTHSFLFLSHEIKTISFEPNPSLKKYFDCLCALNQFNGKMENVAVGEKMGIATLWVPLDDPWEATIVESELYKLKDKPHLEKIEVPLISVDEYVARSGIIPDLIKIDTEGNEMNVLKGALTTIHSFLPHIIFETNNFAERKLFWAFFRDIKYTILELPYRPGKRFKPFSLERFLKKGSTNYIAVPDSKLYARRKLFRIIIVLLQVGSGFFDTESFLPLFS